MGILEAEELMLCNANPRQLATALSIAPLATYQAPYSLLDRDVEWQVAPPLQRHGVGFVAYRPLASGMLGGAAAAAVSGGRVDAGRRSVDRPRPAELATMRSWCRSF
jgi:hypothetical protein